MNRRGFLKILGVASVAPAFPRAMPARGSLFPVSGGVVQVTPSVRAGEYDVEECYPWKIWQTNNNHLQYIPHLYAGQLLAKYYQKSVLPTMCNTNYTGPAKGNDRVTIRTRPDIGLGNS